MSPKKKIIIILGSTSVLLVLLSVLALVPLIRGISKKSQELTELNRNFVMILQKNEKFQEAQKNYIALEPDINKTNNLFISPEFPVDFIKFLENSAKDSSIYIKDIMPFSTDVLSEKDKKQPELWESMSFQVTISGFFPNILKFLDKIENGPYLSRIESFSVVGGGIEQISSGNKEEGEKHTTLSASFLLAVFTK